MAKGFTKRSEDYSKWYNELVVKADLAENSDVRGCMVINYLVDSYRMYKQTMYLKLIKYNSYYSPTFILSKIVSLI